MLKTASLSKVTPLMGVVHVLVNCTNGTKSRKVSNFSYITMLIDRI